MSNEPWKDYQAPAQSGPWDEYAEPQTPTQATPAPAAIERPSSFLRRAVGDTAVDLGKGVVGVGEAAVGLGNLVSGGYVGKGLEAIGYDPQTTKKMLEEGYTHERVAANKAVSDAKGFVGTAKALIQNPSSLIGSAVESAPLMLGGGAVARGGAALLGRAGSIAAPGIGGQLAAIPATTAGRIGLAAAGEGLVGAGSAAEGIRQQSDDGLLSAKQTGAALASGAGTAVLGALGGKVAQKLGIGDIDVALAGGAKAAGEAPKNILRRTIEGMVSEGLLEELPQSMQEQMWQNVATEKPLMEGVPEAAAAGALAGGLMGGGFSALSKPDVRPQPAPNAADKSAGTAGQVPAADTSEPMSGVAAPLSGDIPIQPQTPVAQMAANMRMEAQVQRANAKTVLGRAAADATDMQADAVQASDPFNLSGMGATENTDGFTRLGAIAQSLNLDPDAIVAAARADVGDDPKYSLDGLDDRILASYAQSLAPTVQPAQAQDGFPSEGAVGFQPTPVQAPSVEVPSGQANPVEGGGLASERPAATDVAPAHASVSAAGAQAQGVIYALSAERRSRIVDGLQPNTDLDNALNAILIGGINEQGLMDAVRYGAESGRPEIAAAAAAELRNSANSAAKQKPGVPESSPKYAAIAADLARRAQEAAKLADEAEAIASRRATQPAQPAKAEPAAPPPQAASQQSVADQSQAASLPAIAQEVGGQDRQVEQAGLGSPATDAGTPQAETQTSLGPSPHGTPVEGGGQPSAAVDPASPKGRRAAMEASVPADILAARDAATERLNAASAAMQQFPSGNMGLTPDAVKATPEWKAAKIELDRATVAARNANAAVVKAAKGQASVSPPSAAPASASVGAATEGGQGSVKAAQEGSGFDSEKFNADRAAVVEASRKAGNVHLDKVPAYVESMRAYTIFDVHDPSETGVIDTVDNRGNVYVLKADGTTTTLGPKDLKDFAIAQVPRLDVKALRKLRNKAEKARIAAEDADITKRREAAAVAVAGIEAQVREARPLLKMAEAGNKAQREAARAYLEGEIDFAEFKAATAASAQGGQQEVEGNSGFTIEDNSAAKKGEFLVVNAKGRAVAAFQKNRDGTPKNIVQIDKDAESRALVARALNTAPATPSFTEARDAAVVKASKVAKPKANPKANNPEFLHNGWATRNAELGERYAAAKKALDAAEKPLREARYADNDRLPPGYKTIPYPARDMPEGVALQDDEGNDIAYPLTPREAADRAWKESGRTDRFTNSDAREQASAAQLAALRAEVKAAQDAWDANGKSPMGPTWEAERRVKVDAEQKARDIAAKAARTRAENKAKKPRSQMTSKELREAEKAKAATSNGLPPGFVRVQHGVMDAIVRQADLDGNAPQLRTYTKDGKGKQGFVKRENVQRVEAAQKVATATHADPGEAPEAVTPAVIAEAAKTADRAPTVSMAEARKTLLAQIDAAIKAAPNEGVLDNPPTTAVKKQSGKKTWEVDIARTVDGLKVPTLTIVESYDGNNYSIGLGGKVLPVGHRDNTLSREGSLLAARLMAARMQQGATWKAEGKAGAWAFTPSPVAATDMLTLDVPGDGTFKVLNTKERLTAFRKQVESFFKLPKQETPKPESLTVSQATRDKIMAEAEAVDEPATTSKEQAKSNKEPAKSASPAPVEAAQAGKAEDRAAALASYFKPGNIIKSYAGYDEVLSYRPADGNRSMQVDVHEVRKVNGEWVRVGKPQDARWHSTLPDARELKAGPIDTVPAGDATYTEPRADGRAFPNAPRRSAQVATATHAAPVEAAQPDKNGSKPTAQAASEPVLESVDDTKDLITTHNTTAAKIAHADRMGGFAAPSLAITRGTESIDGFGDITLIGDPALADPRQGAKAFGADVYSPRYPSIEYKLDSASLKNLNDALAPYNEGREIYGGEIRRTEDLTQITAFKDYADSRGAGKGRFSDLDRVAGELLREAGASEVLFEGFTNSGNRKYKPHTLENVVKKLKKELRGGENFNYGTGSLRAKFTPQFSSVAAIRKAKGKLQKKEAFDAAKEEVETELFGIASDLAPYYQYDSKGFGFTDTVLSVIGDSAKGGLDRQLTEYGFDDVPTETRQRIRAYMSALREMPTEYFEVVQPRAVGLSEFRAAVIPSDTAEQTRKVLERAGLNVVEYKAGDADARRDAVQEAASSQALLFHMEAATRQDSRPQPQRAGSSLPNNDAELRIIAREFSQADGMADSDKLGLRKAVNAALGGYPPVNVTYLRGEEGLDGIAKPGYVKRLQDQRASRDSKARTAGLYLRASEAVDGKPRVVLFTDVANTPTKAMFTAAHEIAGHHGLRSLLGMKLNTTLARAYQNPTVKAVADAIYKSRGIDANVAKGRYTAKEGRLLAIEEALADLAAANRLGRYEEIQTRHGVTVPLTQQRGLKATIARIVEAIKSIFRAKNVRFTDAQVHSLLEASWKAAQDRSASFTSLNADGTLEQVVFHGTPHTVDKFSLNKIGTGEGAQAFGWGAYFASSKDIADHYRKGLTERDFINQARDAYDEFDSPDDAIEALREIPGLSGAQVELLDALQADGWLGFDYPHQAISAALRQPQNFELSPETEAAIKKQGNLYRVDVPDDSDLLDWDKPLSEQPKKVRAALQQAASPKGFGQIGARDADRFANVVQGASFRAKGYRGLDVPSQRIVLKGMREVVNNLKVFDAVVPLIPVDMVNVLRGKEFASEKMLHDPSVFLNLLSAEGRGGVALSVDAANSAIRRIADAASAEMPGVRDESVRVPKDFLAALSAGDFDQLAGSKIYGALSNELGSAENASNYLMSIGVSGTRYLDGTSRTKGEGSANYVIWDESAIGQPQSALESVSDDTRDTYNARIDALFKGDKAALKGVRILDRSDVLGMMGLGEGPMNIAEGKVIEGRYNHKLTAADWKKVPGWLENPALVFQSEQGDGSRLVFIAPETVGGEIVRMIVQPNAKNGADVHLLVNAYDAAGGNPLLRWAQDDLLRYVDTKKSPALAARSGRRLPGLADKPRGSAQTILSQKDLGKYRAEAGQAAVIGTPSSTLESTEDQTQTPAFKRWFGSSGPLAVLPSQAAMLEGRPDGNASNSKSAPDLLESQAFRLQGLSGLDVPAQREVLDGVLALGQDRKVLNSVVELIPVEVVNVLRDKKLSPEMLFHNEAVLKDILSADANGSVATAIDVADALVGAVARVATEGSAIATNPLARPSERDTASGADNRDHLHTASINQTANNGTFDPNEGSILESVEDDLFEVSTPETITAADLKIPGQVTVKREGVKGWLNAAGKKLTDLKPAALALVPLNHLADFASKGMTAVQQYIDQHYAMQAYRNGLYRDYDAIAQDWLKYASGTGIKGFLGKAATQAGRDLSDLMHDSTIAGIDPSVENASYKEADKQRIYNELRARYTAMPEQGQALFNRVRDAYKRQSTMLEEVIEANLKRAMEINKAKAERDYEDRIREIEESGASDDEKARLKANAANLHDDRVKEADQRTNAKTMALRATFESMRVEAPYFPLKRYGKYWVTVLKNGTMQGFSKFQTAEEQDAFVKQMKAQGFDVRTKYEGGDTKTHEMIDPAFIAEIEGILEGAQMPDSVKDDIWQAYLERMPDMSLRKSFIHRQKVQGYHPDALKAFSSTSFHGSYQLARLKYGMEMAETLDIAEKQAARVAPVQGEQLVGELRKRHAFIMNPTGGALAQGLTTAAFVYYLGANPAHLLLNATQTVMLGIPILGTRYGFWRTTNALQKAMRDFASGKGHLENANLTADERKAFQAFIDSGLIDKTQAHDLAGVGETGVEYNAVRQKVMNKIGWFFHQSERFNREVTAMAAYRLARQDGRSHDTAVAQAMRATYEIHFDYSAAARARVMQGDVAKSLLVFRNYQVNVLYRLFRDIHQSLRGESVQVRREARKQLGAMMGMYGLFAGVAGMPFYGLAMALAGAFEDDDDPETAEQQFVRGTVELIGPDVARVLLKGVPGAAFNIDLTDRIGMPNLWFRSPDRELEGRDAYYYWMEQVLGAGVGVIKQGYDGASLIFDGLQDANSGHVARGLEKMLPAAARNVFKSVRYGADGVTTLNGEKILDLGAGGLVAQGLGYTPLDLAERYDANRELKNANAKLERRRRALLDRLFLASQHGDPTDRAMLDIQAFNAKNPDYAITRQMIGRSAKLRNRNRLLNENGIVMTRRMRRLQERMIGSEEADE